MASQVGTNGDDYLAGGSARDFIYGKAGRDRILGGGGSDRLYGGDGDDTLLPGDPTSQYDGADLIDGGLGRDIVDYSNALVVSSRTTVIDLANTVTRGGAAKDDSYVNVEGVLGTLGADRVYGDDRNNDFYAGLGGDRYDGRGGRDTYYGTQETGNYTMTVAFGAAAQALVGSSITLAAGEGVALYNGFTDVNGNGLLDPLEPIFTRVDRLLNIESIVGSGASDRIGGTSGSDVFGGSNGADTFQGGAGEDFVSYDLTSGVSAPAALLGAVSIDLAAGSAVKAGGAIDRLESIEGAIGTAFDDDITGNAGRNRLFGLGGDDALDGGSGDDILIGGTGDDILVGGSGNDVLRPGAGEDMIDGGGGDDLVSYVGAETSIAVSLLKQIGLRPIIDGFPVGESESTYHRMVSIENVDGSAHDDVITGSNGANRLTGMAGSDKIEGCDGDDIIYGEVDAARVLPNLTDPRGLDLDGDGLLDCGCGGAVLVGSGGGDADSTYDDELHGGNGKDAIYGGLGTDLIYGDSGDDTLDGGAGTDMIYGGSGNDLISGGAGFDFIFGGSGSDTVTYDASSAGVVVDLASYWNNSGGDAASDFITEILGSLAGQGSDAALSSAPFLSLIGSLGSDDDTTLFSLAIPDVMIDVEHATGSRFADTLSGNAGANTLTGGAGNDILNGQAGSDRLIGGAGKDVLTGGAGADRFVFALADLNKTAANADRIADFSRAQRDRIDLSAIDAINGGANNAFKFIGAAAFTGNAGELRAYASGSETFAAGDTNGDKRADFLIALTGAPTLVAADFVL